MRSFSLGARALAMVGGLIVILAAALPAAAQTGTAALKPCTPKTPMGIPCTPYFGGALRLGDKPYTDSIMGAPCNVAGCGTSTGEVHNFSATGDGNIWIVNFSYTPGDPISDTAVGVLIYDDSWNVVQQQTVVGDPPHSVWFPFPTNNGTVYQVQVFNYTPNLIKYTISLAKAP
ncbi:MAG TPA: hypothetical protein VF157_16535 [Chloroflexota bacterium]